MYNGYTITYYNNNGKDVEVLTNIKCFQSLRKFDERPM